MSALGEADRLMADVADAARALEVARAAFARAILAAHPTWSYQQIATAAGLSKQRIHQIVREAQS